MATVKHPSNPLPFTFVKAQHLGPLRYTHRLQVSDGNELHHEKKTKKEKNGQCSNIAETKVAHLGELDEADSWGGDCWMIQQQNNKTTQNKTTTTITTIRKVLSRIRTMLSWLVKCISFSR